MNVLIDKGSLKVAGLNRSAFSNEFEVIGVSDIQKEITVPVKIQKVNKDQEPLFRLPRPEKEIITPTPKLIETIEVTEQPVMIKQINKVPLLDSEGNQITYQPTTLGETTEVTDEPVMDIVQNEDGTTTEEQKVNENGELLYWGQVPSGSVIACFTTKEVDVQKEDAEGNKIYLKEITEDVITYEPQASWEITEGHNLWTEDLEPIMIDAEEPKVVKLSEAPEYFSYEEIDPSLSALKRIKLAELTNACNYAILGRFTSNVNGVDYQFSNDAEAQQNFSKVKDAFTSNYIDSMPWTAYLNGEIQRLVLDWTTFEPVYKDHLNHIQYNVSKLRDYLQPLVEGAISVEEILSVKW